MDRQFDTNFILNSCFDNRDSLVLDRYNDNYIFNAIFDQDKSSLRVKIEGMPDVLIPGKYLVVNSDGTGFTLVDNNDNDFTSIISDFKRIINELNRRIDNLSYTKPKYVYDTYIPLYRVAVKKPIEKIIRNTNLVLPIRQEVFNNKKSSKSIEIKGYFTIPGLGGNYKISGDRVINRDGIDLRMFLPIYFNITNLDTILCAYTDYKVEDGHFKLEYMTKDKYGNTKLFMAGNNLWRKYFQ